MLLLLTGQLSLIKAVWGDVDTLNLAYAYDYNGDAGLADSYAGIEFLGASPFKTSTSYQSWTFNSS